MATKAKIPPSECGNCGAPIVWLLDYQTFVLGYRCRYCGVRGYASTMQGLLDGNKDEGTEK
jgi:prepilin signal peptidase PulO-like enzyme (type II secretory pathway)